MFILPKQNIKALPQTGLYEKSRLVALLFGNLAIFISSIGTWFNRKNISLDLVTSIFPWVSKFYEYESSFIYSYDVKIFYIYEITYKSIDL